MIDDDALWCSGRSGGVDDVGGVLRAEAGCGRGGGVAGDGVGLGIEADEAGAVALARLRNNRILMAVGRAESNMLDFYVSGSDQPTGWSYRDTWWQSEPHTTLPDGDDEFGDYQGLSFVTRCGDGAPPHQHFPPPGDSARHPAK